MNMKGHILSALREQIDRWEELLASMSEEQILAPLLPSPWSTKDVVAHIMAWRLRSIARVEAARFNREPGFPIWIPGADPDDNTEENTEQTNAWIYETYHNLPWSQVHQDWLTGSLRFLETSEQISEINLLATGIYSWLGVYPLAYILLASYDHYQEHYDKLLDWLKEHGITYG